MLQFSDLQLDAVATGNGTSLLIDQWGGAFLVVSGTFVATVTFEATIDRQAWFAIEVVNVADGTLATTATAAGMFFVGMPGALQLRARISTYTSGSVSVRGRPVPYAGVPASGGTVKWRARLTGLIAADTEVKAAPGAGLSLYITDVFFSIGAATASSILLEEGTTTAVFGPHYVEAVSGRGIPGNLNTPIKIAANTALTATGSGATTATLDVYGYTAAG